MITRFQLPKHGQEAHGWIKLEAKKQKFEKPNIRDLKEIIGVEVTDENAQLLLEQMEELCLIVIEQYANGQEI